RALYWLAVVLPDRVTKPLIQVIEYLMHVLSIVISSKQALPHEAFRDPARHPLVEAAAPDHTIKDRQNPDQDLDVPALHRVRHGDSRIISHDTTMPAPTVRRTRPGGIDRTLIASAQPSPPVDGSIDQCPADVCLWVVVPGDGPAAPPGTLNSDLQQVLRIGLVAPGQQ